MNEQQLREWDNAHVWHPFTPMRAHIREEPPIIEASEGFELIDEQGRRYLDGISSLWCNVHGHKVPAIDAAIQEQLGKIAHSTLLGLGNRPSIELARRLVELAPAGLNKVFYSDSGSTAVEAALKIAFQYHTQKAKPQTRTTYLRMGSSYHGDTIGSVSVGGISIFHQKYGRLLFDAVEVPPPVACLRPPGVSAEEYLSDCDAQLEQLVQTHASNAVAFVIEPLVQGAAGILVHPQGYLTKVRELTKRYDIPLIADEVAVGFGRTGTMFACEQEQVTPDFLCLAKGITGGYLPLAATLTTDEIYAAFLAEPHEAKTFFHGHTYTGNPLGCAAALASLDLFERNDVLRNAERLARTLCDALAVLNAHPHVAEIRQKGTMVGIDLMRDREQRIPFPPEQRMGHQVTLAARERGVVIRPLGDTVVLMPAPAMPINLAQRLCDVVIESINEI